MTPTPTPRDLAQLLQLAHPRRHDAPEVFERWTMRLIEEVAGPSHPDACDDGNPRTETPEAPGGGDRQQPSEEAQPPVNTAEVVIGKPQAPNACNDGNPCTGELPALRGGQRTLMEAFAAEPGATLSPTDLKARTGLSESTVSNALTRMKRKGLVGRVGFGRYRVTCDPAEALAMREGAPVPNAAPAPDMGLQSSHPAPTCEDFVSPRNPAEEPDTPSVSPTPPTPAEAIPSRLPPRPRSPGGGTPKGQGDTVEAFLERGQTITRLPGAGTPELRKALRERKLREEDSE